MFVVFSFPQSGYSQPCPSNNYTLVSQAAVDAFPQDCTEIGALGIGALSIGTPERGAINSLAPLANVKVIRSLSIRNTDSLKTLAGLDSVVSVQRINISSNSGLESIAALGTNGISGLNELTIHNNDLLTSLLDLQSTTILDKLWITSNDVLTDLSGLQSVSTVNEINISGNLALTTLSDLDGLSSLRTLKISGNPALTDLSGMESLRNVGRLSISDNVALKDITGLKNLSVFMRLVIANNESLSSFAGLSQVDLRGEALLEIINQDLLTSLDELADINPRGIILEGNDSLTDISAFATTPLEYIFVRENASLVTLGRLDGPTYTSWLVEKNPQLISLGDFPNVTHAGVLRIIDNPLLTDLAGLKNVRSVGEVAVSSNDKLESLQGLGGRGGLSSVDYGNISGNPILKDCGSAFYSVKKRRAFEIGLVMSNNDPNGDCNNDGWHLRNDSGACRVSEYSLRSQADVFAFAQDCRVLTGGGTLSIRGADIIDLSPLSRLTELEGALDISSNPQLTSLWGLDSLQRVRNIFLSNNPELRDISSLQQITEIPGEISLRNNSALSNIEVFANVTSTINQLYIGGNDSLRSLRGLENIVQVRRNVSIIDNPIENLHGLENLETIGNTLAIKADSQLTTLAGLNSLDSVSTIQITANPQLADLEGLSRFQNYDLTGDLWVSDNDKLQSLDGLSGFTIVRGDVIVSDHEFLTDISALGGLDSVGGDLRIHDNSFLFQCSAAISNLVYDGRVVGEVSMFNNNSAGDCNDNGQDLVPVSTDDLDLPLELQVFQNYPNPFARTTTINYQVPEPSEVRFEVVDLLGRNVRSSVQGAKAPGTHTIQFDSRGLSSGVYFYRIVANGAATESRQLLIAK